ncbi:MAG: RluA family pseudouridine synthase [Spirochaetales bacterium]|nr:RluA family pseudouridine synthase [Spirochaetales bacterium]
MIVPIGIKVQRVDGFIAEQLGTISRSNLKNRIDSLLINGEISKLSKKIHDGDIIEYSLKKQIDTIISPEKIDLDIIYEDDNVFVINKPEGMVVHPAAGNYSGTMAQGIMYLLQNEDTDFAVDDTRPGIVHRLDKDTSGIIIAAKNSRTLSLLSEQFQNRTAVKTYLAVINGRLPKKKGRIETLIGRDKNNRKKMTWKTERGKEAITEYRVLKEWDGKSFVALYLKTGRTHQLRVHMLSMGTPIVGDSVYSRKPGSTGLLLHAYRLRIEIPGVPGMSDFRAPLPERFKEAIRFYSDKG